MKEDLAVFNSDKINRYGFKLDVKILESALSQSWDLGTPSFLSHDYHRPVAWSKALSLYMESGLVRLTGITLMPENDKDSEKINDAVKYYLSKHIDKFVAPKRSELKKRLSPHFSDQAIECMPGCVALIDNDLAAKIFPEIYQKQDDDGLVPLSLLNPLAPGVFQKDGLLLFAHKYFRRSLSVFNTLNTEFLELLQQLNNDHPELDIHLAIDADMVGLADTFLHSIEFEYWWGPKFSDNLAEIPLGVTRHNSNEQQKLFHGVSQTEFWWHSQNEIQTLEAEELRDIPSFGAGYDYFGCRYIHCMLKEPGHLDGAIRMYDEESMLERIDKNIKEAGRHSKYTKLWKVDGNLDVSIWKELITHYYRDNYLVGEYLGGKDESEHIQPHIVSPDTYDKPLSEYIPCNMKSGQGIRMSVSYHPKSEEIFEGRFIKPFNYLSHNSSSFKYIEEDTIEIIKMLENINEHISYPEDIIFISFEDLVINFPLICHTGLNSASLAKKTLGIIKELCGAWEKRGDDRIITYNIGIQYADRDVYFSIAGHVKDLCIWHQKEEIKFPSDVSMLGDWCEKEYKFISNNFPKQHDFPPLQSIHQNNGLLRFERRFLKPDEYKIRVDKEKKSIICDIISHKKRKELLVSGELQVACAFQINPEYSNPSIIGPFWTNRKASLIFI